MLSYAVGKAEPTPVFVRRFGRGEIPTERVSEIVRNVFHFRPAASAHRLGLWTLPREHVCRFCQRLATGGLVGRTDLDLPWERADAVDQLRRAAGA